MMTAFTFGKFQTDSAVLYVDGTMIPLTNVTIGVKLPGEKYVTVQCIDCHRSTVLEIPPLGPDEERYLLSETCYCGRRFHGYVFNSPDEHGARIIDVTSHPAPTAG